LALREKGRNAEDGEHCHGRRNDGKAGDTSDGSACFYLKLLLFLRHRFPHKSRHGVFSSQKKFLKLDQRASPTIAIRPDLRARQLDNGIDDTFVSSVRKEVDRTTLPTLSIDGSNQPVSDILRLEPVRNPLGE
jgi:hypothetical protein